MVPEMVPIWHCSGTIFQGTDTNGNALRDEPADILAHELVGHGIPELGITDTGNAVENENKVRSQLGTGRDQLRAAEPSHAEW